LAEGVFVKQMGFGKFLFVFLLSFVGQVVAIDIDDFVQLPDVEKVTLSPSGHQLAMLKRVFSQGKRMLVVEVTDLNKAKSSYPVVVKNNEFAIKDIVWARNKKLNKTGIKPGAK
jgi:hypothetical protein